MPDISKLVKVAGIDAERTATELFGIAVEDFAAKPLNALLKGALGGPENPPVNRNDGSWYATSYAASQANSLFRPKLKFLFRVEFLFKPEILEQYQAQTAAWKNNFTFLIKSVDRPKVDFEYEEINQYNFRTKVLKMIKHRELTMTFSDDVGNTVYEFFRFMLMVHSPITRRSAGSSHNIADYTSSSSTGNGMLFSGNLGNLEDSASRGVLNTDVGNAIQAIKITQMFVQPGSAQHDLDTGAKEVSFIFINPRMVSFDLDDLNHETSEANLFTMQFDYDSMVLTDARLLQALPPEKSMPPVGTAPGEAAPTGRAPGDQNPEGNNNPYTKLLSGVAARAAQRITSETIGRQLRRVPGLGSVSDVLGGLVQGITRDRVAGLGSALNQSFARPSRDVVSDNSTAGRDSSTFVTSRGGFGTDQPSVDSIEESGT